MRKICICLTAILLMSFIQANAQTGNIEKMIKGNWELTVANAPEGYQNFTMEVKEKEGVYTFDVNGDVYLQNQKLTLKEGKMTASVFVEENINIVIWEEKNVVKGMAKTSMGDLPIVFKRATPKKESK